MSNTTTRTTQLGVPQRPFRRSNSDAVLGGVCSGIATRLGVRVQSVRVLFSLVTLMFGGGLVLYMVLWMAVPRWGEEHAILQRLFGERGAARSLVATAGLVALILFILNLAHHRLRTTFILSVLLLAMGALAVWRGSNKEELRHLQGVLHAAPVVSAASARGWKALSFRVIPGVLLIVIGLQVLRQIGGIWGGAIPAFLGGAALLVGVLVLLAPWWLTNVRDLSQERRARIRSEERASLAAHVHDSVLQTLTLIERASGDQAEVVRLARSQERALRDWLFAPDPSTSGELELTFKQELRRVQSDVERDYKIRVELVIVGDCAADESVRALVGAAREAAVNAAKWSGVASVSIYGEVEPDQVSLYVRDTGVGFEPASVDLTRQGITHSILERVHAHAGTVDIVSRPGKGTEVRLTLPRARTAS
ncbi:MAG TPA: PspC domain-containing protein [Acidimicrobiales bacterium]|nr:PspC domain-containing protein [Acidimicrobiales bacterium]